MTTTAPNFGYAAFAPEDVQDAKHRGPDVDLSGYAAARGLEFLGSALPNGFVAVVPEFPEYLQNTLRGQLYNGNYGMLAHRLYEVGGAGDDGLSMPGTYFGQRSNYRSGYWWDPFTFFERPARHAPFAADAVWLPTTMGAARVTEAALVPQAVFRRAENFPWTGVRNLSAFDLPGYRMADGPTDDKLLGRLLGGLFGSVVRSLPYRFVEVVVDAGHVALVRNGYAKSQQEMDELAGHTAALADALRAACGPLAQPQPFGVALPPPTGEADNRPRGRLASLYVDYREIVASVAAELGMTLEDARSFHRAYPTQPVPGTAQGVLRGTLPGTQVQGRLAWYGDGVRPVGGWMRGAVLLPARPGAATDGPVMLRDAGVLAEVRDGIAACWTQGRRKLQTAPQELLAAAIPALRRLGLADV